MSTWVRTGVLERNLLPYPTTSSCVLGITTHRLRCTQAYLGHPLVNVLLCLGQQHGIGFLVPTKLNCKEVA
jgi:hypothetical protein